MSRGEMTVERAEHLESLLWLAVRVAECHTGVRENFDRELRRAEETWRRLPAGWDTSPREALADALAGPSRKRLVDVALDLISEERGRPCRCTGDDLVELARELDGTLDVRTVRMTVTRGLEYWR